MGQTPLCPQNSLNYTGYGFRLGKHNKGIFAHAFDNASHRDWWYINASKCPIFYVPVANKEIVSKYSIKVPFTSSKTTLTTQDV